MTFWEKLCVVVAVLVVGYLICKIFDFIMTVPKNIERIANALENKKELRNDSEESKR